MAPEHDPRPAGEQSPAAVPPDGTPPPITPPPITPAGDTPPRATPRAAPPPGVPVPFPTGGPVGGPAPVAGPAGGPAPVAVARQGGFRGWRRRRPLWGGLCVLIGGGEILLSERANITVVLHAGAESLAGYLLPGVIAVCGLLLIFNPMHRTFYSVIAVLCSLGTWITSNLGGFIVGMLLGLVGSSLAFGWVPDQEPRRWRRRKAAAVRS